jgi:hypothetical protein
MFDLHICLNELPFSKMGKTQTGKDLGGDTEFSFVLLSLRCLLETLKQQRPIGEGDQELEKRFV